MNELSCEEALNLLLEREDSPLPPERERELDEHLGRCDACRAESEKLERLEGLLTKTPVPAVTREKLNETVGAVVREIESGRKTPAFPSRSLPRWAVAAAILVVVAGGGIFALWATGLLQGGEGDSIVTNDPGGSRSEAPPIQADRPATSGEGLVEQLVRGDLALSEAEIPAEKALIFCGMSRDVLRALRGATESRDGDTFLTLGRGYTSLINEGVYPHLDPSEEEGDREKLAEVIGLLERGGENLRSLMARAQEGQLDVLAEALTATTKCRERAEAVSAH